MITIDYDKCCWKDGKCTSGCCGTKCDGCVEACPTGALQRQKLVIFDADKCVDCGVCIEACKYKAIKAA